MGLGVGGGQARGAGIMDGHANECYAMFRIYIMENVEILDPS